MMFFVYLVAHVLICLYDILFEFARSIIKNVP